MRDSQATSKARDLSAVPAVSRTRVVSADSDGRDVPLSAPPVSSNASMHAQESAQAVAQRKADRDKSRRKESLTSIRKFLINAGVAAFVAWFCLTFVFGLYIQSGEGMYPRMRDGDLVLFYRLDSDYAIDDVLTFEYEGVRCTARLVATEGDVVDMSEEGELIINGSVQLEEIFYPTYDLESDIEFPYTVPEGSYFVLGDFRTNTTDSRIYGAIAQEDIDGTVVTIMRRRDI